MANPRWTGATDGDFNTATNWSTGSVPVTGDLVTIPTGVTRAIDTNLDQSAKNFAGILVQPGSKVQVGASGNPLKCAVDKSGGASYTGIVSHFGDKAFYLKAAHATLDINLVLVDSDNMTLALQIDDDATAQILALRCLKGRTEAAPSITALPHVEVGRRSNPDSDVDLLLDTHATNVVGMLIQNGGLVTLKREATDVIAAGGLLIASGTEPITNLYGAGGTIEYNTTGTLALAVMAAGFLDFTKDYQAKTVTSLYSMRPATIARHPGITITNDWSQGGTVVDDPTLGEIGRAHV